MKQGPLSYLNNVCRRPMGNECSPEGFDKDPQATVKLEDLKPEAELKKVIKSSFQQKYLDLLLSKHVFTESA